MGGPEDIILYGLLNPNLFTKVRTASGNTNGDFGVLGYDAV
jgi:hypothetical protein